MSALDRARVRRIRDRLREVYGRPFAPPHGQGLDELILTVLSQSTNDRNRDVAFLALRARFGGWAAVRDAPNADVERAIRPGGISKVKSVRIQEILREIDIEDFDERPRRTARSSRAAPSWSRCPASAARPPRACCCSPTASATSRSTRTCRAWARGSACSARARRSRNCTTRCSSSRRTGQELEFHVNLLRHGRRTCHSRRPKCEDCALLGCARPATICAKQTEIL